MNLSVLLAGAFDYRLLETVIISLVNTVLMFFASFKFMQTLQQSGYEGKGYLSWLKRRDNIYMMRLVIVSFLSVLAFMIFNIAVMIFVDAEWIAHTGFVFYVLFLAVYIKKDRVTKAKVPLIKTNRVKRLIVTFVLVSLLTTALALSLLNLIGLWDDTSLLFRLRYGVVCFSPLLLPFTVLAAFYIKEPARRPYKNRYNRQLRQDQRQGNSPLDTFRKVFGTRHAALLQHADGHLQNGKKTQALTSGIHSGNGRAQRGQHKGTCGDGKAFLRDNYGHNGAAYRNFRLA